jgi:chaperonin GroES
MNLEATLSLSKIVKSPNVADLLSESDLTTIGNAVWDEWTIDKDSRYDWEERTADAMKLAQQVKEEKTFPWAGASNVKFPLVTIAALQYQSRAYPALIPDVNVVKARVIGTDLTGEKQARADRVSQFMSFQVLEEDENWEENMDKVLIEQAIVGCAFKKSFFDPALQHNVSVQVLSQHLYIPYFAQSLEKASRITQVLFFSENEMIENERKGLFLKYDRLVPPTVDDTSPMQAAHDEAQGTHDPKNDPATPYELLEQHRWLDLDGDGYQEPYVVTIVKETKQVLRIVARFSTSKIQRRKGEVVYIEPDHYFTKFSFIPSPDGGIYDLGFGVLLGPLNESINTILNQLVDAGTLSNTAGGFLGRGVKFRSGDNSFRPFEWKRVDSTGDDLHKGIFPLPVREPSLVLFQLLGLLIDYGERIGMATDPMVGVNPGQNTPAETSRNMLAEGQRIFSAVYKRTYRALKEEFRKLYKLNGIFLNDEQEFYSLINEGTNIVFASDFAGDGKDVVPAADPNMVSDAMKLQQILMMKESALQTPGYNPYQLEKKFLQALKVTDIEAILPDPQGPNALPPPGPDAKIVVEGMKIQQRQYEFQANLQIKLAELQAELQQVQAEIVETQTKAALNLANAEGVEAGHQVAALQQMVSLLKQKQDGIISSMKMLHDLQKLDLEKEKLDASKSRGVQSSS